MSEEEGLKPYLIKQLLQDVENYGGRSKIEKGRGVTFLLDKRPKDYPPAKSLSRKLLTSKWDLFRRKSAQNYVRELEKHEVDPSEATATELSEAREAEEREAPLVKDAPSQTVEVPDHSGPFKTEPPSDNSGPAQLKKESDNENGNPSERKKQTLRAVLEELEMFTFRVTYSNLTCDQRLENLETKHKIVPIETDSPKERVLRLKDELL